MSLPATTIPEQAAATSEPPRRTIPVVATEDGSWRWTFAPAVPDAVRPRLADLAAELADHRALRDELDGWPRHARDAEWELACVRQEELAATAFDAALALGFRLIVRPAVGRPRERGGEQ